MKLIYDRETGWGNTLLQLSDFVALCICQNKIPHLPEPIECVEGITVSTEPEEEGYKANIFMNNLAMQHVHPLIRQFTVPTPKIRELVAKNAHGCTTGLHIRRGNYGTDSKALDDGTPHEHAAWFCDDEALGKFIKVIEETPACVFVTTDSMELRKHLLQKYPHKVRMNEIKSVVHSRRCDGADNTDMYVDWFLLSQCKKIYITAGIPGECKGFSTFGYTAGVYGQTDIHLIFNKHPQSS